jgi:CRISPR-associated protein Cas8a1/Csx13
MTPTSARECQIANAADGALQAQVRLRARRHAQASELLACAAMTFRPTPWASQQKSRVETLTVPPGDDCLLDRFEAALAQLPCRIVTRTVQEASGRRRTRTARERSESFRAESVVRPLVADNLARGRPWYAGFVRLMTALDDQNRPLRDRLPFERRGLHAMTSNPTMWDHPSEPTLVRAVHQAIRFNLGRIRQDTDGNGPLSQATRNRWNRFRERLRLALVGAKTADQCRGALCILFANAGQVPELQQGWEVLGHLLSDRRWQLARDLGLLGLASYVGAGAEDQPPAPTSTEPQEAN